MAFDNTTTTVNSLTHDELISHLVTEDEIIMIYKQHALMTNNYGLVPIKMIKRIYSRFDGSCKEIHGKLIPAQNETYSFEE